jgi:hypothetical protein
VSRTGFPWDILYKPYGRKSLNSKWTTNQQTNLPTKQTTDQRTKQATNQTTNKVTKMWFMLLCYYTQISKLVFCESSTLNDLRFIWTSFNTHLQNMNTASVKGRKVTHFRTNWDVKDTYLNMFLLWHIIKSILIHDNSLKTISVIVVSVLHLLCFIISLHPNFCWPKG